MITLNTEKELVRIASWDDILSRPGFTPDVDPKTVKLKSIIGSYSLPAEIPCGLSTCHQPHLNGYLVAAQDGLETNIGQYCGKKHFSVEFTQLRNAFMRDFNAKLRREHLWSLKHRLPSIKQELAQLKNDPLGATWIHNKISQLLGNSGTLPSTITNAVREASRAGNGALIVQRRLTQEERQRASAASDIAGLERRPRQETFTQEIVGQLEGYAALTRENSLRTILHDKLVPFIDSLEASDIDSLGPKQLNSLYRAGSDFDALMDRLRSAISQGLRLLTRRNIEQLRQFAVSPSERRAFESFSSTMPAEA